MTTPTWEPGRLYPPGSLVLPRTGTQFESVPLENPGFEAGNTSGWTTQFIGGTGTASASTARPYAGTYSALYQGASGSGHMGGVECVWTNNARQPVAPGVSVTATAYIALDDTGSSQNQGRVRLYWLDSLGAVIGAPLQGTLIRGDAENYRLSTATGSAPAGAVEAALVVWTTANNSGGSAVRFDQCSWSTTSSAPSGLVYRAVQPTTGYSGTTEPAWPPTAGVQVNDNEVIWEGVVASRVVWEASPILLSGSVEPTWSEIPGTYVSDNTISWEVVTRSVDDPKCPQTKIVVIAASKVFAGDGDIIAFSATVNPLDWSSEGDAGYLANGLRQYGSNPVAAMGLYRDNLVAFNAEGFLMAQVDEDPAAMAFLDGLPISSMYHHALCPVANDLLFLSSEGVRSIGIAGGSTNLQAGDVGMPVDPIVQEALATSEAAGFYPIALYYPAAGQYWLIFNTADAAEVFVYTKNRTGQPGAWTRYELPYRAEDWCIKGNDLYLRSGDNIYRMDEEAIGDQVLAGGEPMPFPGVVWWPYLDLGSPGITKMVTGFDIVGEGQPQFQLGYNQNNSAAFTAPLTVPADSVPGMILPVQVSAPSFAPRLTYDGTTRWHFRALNLYLADNRMAT